MSKKGKGGKGGKKDKKGKQAEAPVEIKEVLTEVDRTFYELTIEDIKKKILRLRSHIQNLGVANEAIAAELRAMKEDKTDEAGELTQQVDEIHDNIIEIRSENAQLTESYNNEKRRSEETISDLEKKYKAMHDQLSAEIKRLNGKLNACEEFRLNRDNWMVKFTERADEIAEKEEDAKEAFRQMEAKSVYERELLKDELLGKLTLAGEEFSGAGTSNASDFNLRLIRENIALQKNIDMLINSNNEMDRRIKEESELYETNKKQIPILEKKNSRLILESQVKLNNINILSDKVHKLKQEYIDSLTYREQNISIKEFQICARYRRRKLQRLIRQVGQQINAMDREMNLYDYLIAQYNAERIKIEKHLENVRHTIEIAIGVVDEEQQQQQEEKPLDTKSSILSEQISSYHERRHNLLNLLVELLQIDFDLLDPGRRASIETLKPYEKLTRFDELFKKEAPSMSSLMDLCVAYIDSDAITESQKRGSSAFSIALPTEKRREITEYETIIPDQRHLGKNYIFDVESGTTLYYSSELEDPERMEAEDQGAAAEGEEEGESSSSDGVPAGSGDGDSSPTKKAPTTASTTAGVATAPSDVSGPSKLPPGTIVDVEIATEEEDVDYLSPRDEGVDEDEEYDINLFY